MNEQEELLRKYSEWKKMGYDVSSLERDIRGLEVRNRKSMFSRNLVVCLLILFLVLVIFSDSSNLKLTGHIIFEGGDGSLGNPYQIGNCTQLQGINESLDANYILINNIGCNDSINWESGKGFNPIGNSTDQFTGNFDGKNYTIENLYINRFGESEVGFISYVGYGGNVTQIGLLNISIKNPSYNVGGLAAVNNGSITYSYTTGEFIDCPDGSGGLVADNYGLINNSFSSVFMKCTFNADGVGGLVSSNFEGIISNSYATGNIFGDSGVGGLVGSSAGGIISDCYAIGNVTSDSRNFGGFIGSVVQTDISNCFSTGNVTEVVGPNSNFGGFIGAYSSGTITNCYYNNQSGNPDEAVGSGPVQGVYAIQDDENYFKGDVYPNNEPMASWSFYSVWEENSSDYPKLMFQGLGAWIGEPEVALVILRTTNPSTNDTYQNLTGTVIAIDPEDDNITFWYNWYRNNGLNATTLIKEGLVAYWPLNNDTYDYRLDNDGIIEGDAEPNLTSYKLGGAYEFDGEGDVINITGSDDFDLVNHSLAAWIRANDYTTGAFQTIISDQVNGAAADGGFSLGINPSGDLNYAYAYGAGAGSSVYHTDYVDDGEWHFVVATYEYDGTNSIKSCYSDARFIDSYSSATPKITYNNQNAYIGGSDIGFEFNGTIDEVMIFNRSLSQQEIEMLYYGGKYGGNKMHFNHTSVGDNWILGVRAGDNSSFSKEVNSSEVEILALRLVGDCRALDEPNTVYVLQNNITCEDTCFWITANNVTLDFNGYSVTGNQTGSIVAASNYDNATIKNGFAYNASKGIYFYGVENGVIFNMTCDSHVLVGAHIYNCLNVSVINSSFSNNGYEVIYNHNGVRFEPVDNGRIIDNEFNNNSNSIRIAGGSYNAVEGNIVYSIRSQGIQVTGSENNTIINNKVFNCSDNHWGAIGIHNSDNNTVINNLVVNSSSSGIRVTIDSEKNTIINNTVKDHYIGLQTSYSSYTLFINNTVLNSSGRAIRTDHIDNCVFKGNNLTYNNQGMTTYNSTNNNITENFFSFSGDALSLQSNWTTGNRVINNTFLYNGRGIQISSWAFDNLVENNTIKNNDEGIYFNLAGENNTIKNNIIENSTYEGIDIRSTSLYNIILENIISNSSRYGVYIYSNSSNSLLLNNQIYGNNQTIFDETNSSYENYLIYNNSQGEINWIGNRGNLTIKGNLTFPGNIDISNNNGYLNTEGFEGNINTSADITFYNVAGFSNPIVLRNGVECSDCNVLSYDGLTIIFNVRGFTNYSIGEGPSLAGGDTEGRSSGDGGGLIKFDAYNHNKGKNETHLLKIERLDRINEIAYLRIVSANIEFELELGGGIEVDVTRDGYLDTYFEFENITNGRAEILIEVIPFPIEKEIEKEIIEEERFSLKVFREFCWICLLGILLALVLILILILIAKRIHSRIYGKDVIKKYEKWKKKGLDVSFLEKDVKFLKKFNGSRKRKKK